MCQKAIAMTQNTIYSVLLKQAAKRRGPQKERVKMKHSVMHKVYDADIKRKDYIGPITQCEDGAISRSETLATHDLYFDVFDTLEQAEAHRDSLVNTNSR